MDALDKYIIAHSSRQSEALEWVQKQTNIRTNHARMLSGAVQGKFLEMVVRMCGAKRILELGTFTGYSAICLASGMGPGGHLDTLEINDELEDLILEGFRRAGLDEVISLHIGDALKTLDALREKASADPSLLYDLVFIDANKRDYPEYYEKVFDLVRPGGWILGDNVLWDGKVCQEPMPQDKQTVGIDTFNKIVRDDPRVESVILPLRDGLNIIRKL